MYCVFLSLRTHMSRLWILRGKQTKLPLLFKSYSVWSVSGDSRDRKEGRSWLSGSLPWSKVLEKGIFTDRRKARTSSNARALLNLEFRSPWRCINFLKLWNFVRAHKHNSLWKGSTALNGVSKTPDFPNEKLKFSRQNLSLCKRKLRHPPRSNLQKVKQLVSDRVLRRIHICWFPSSPPPSAPSPPWDVPIEREDLSLTTPDCHSEPLDSQSSYSHD